MAIDTPTMHQIISTVFADMLGMPTEVLGPETSKIEQPRYSAAIEISGEVEEQIVVEATQATATAIAETMFCTPADELEEDEVQDALGEIANMVGGNVKGTYPGELKLSLPVVTTVEGDNLHGTETQQTHVAIDGQQISIFWQDKTSASV